MKLNGVSTLLVDSDTHTVQIMQQMMRGLGMDPPTVARNGSEARALLQNATFDLCIIEANLPDLNGAALVQELRQKAPPQKFTPTIIVTAYSHLRNVTRGRDCGSNTIVKKPISPQVLFDHIAWAAHGTRPFVEASAYIGPDRRFKFSGAPDGVGRRDTDLPIEIGEATEPNMSQDEIDAMVKPTRIVTA